MKTTNSSCIFDEALATRLARLRDLLVTGQELAEASHYFHEALVPDEIFLREGSGEENSRLLAIISGVLKAIAPGGELACPMTLRLEKYAMCHGCAFWGGGVAMFFYFDELDLGLCSYQRNLADPYVRFVRFSVSQAHNGWFASRQRGSA
jgi:hypothetical protein